MKLYEFSLAPGPRRVRIFIAEKGIEIPSVQINTRERQQFTDEYRAVNPNCVVPTLVLDDGTCLGETVAICRYLEETHPEPNLMGRDAREKAVIEMWNRQAELEGYLAAVDAVRNSAPMFEGRGGGRRDRRGAPDPGAGGARQAVHGALLRQARRPACGEQPISPATCSPSPTSRRS